MTLGLVGKAISRVASFFFNGRNQKDRPGLVTFSANSTGVVMSELGANRVPKIDWWEVVIWVLLVGAISTGALILVH